MTAEIGAPAAGAPAGWPPEGEAGLEAGVVGEAPDTPVVFGGCPEPPLLVCEHPAISNDTATNAAIRIPPG
jgi:hypothetical protein